MKRETLEKIRNILEHLLELFISILIMLISFGSLHVHAATVTPKGSLILESSSGDYLSTAYTSYVRVYSEDSPPVKFASFVRYGEIDKGDSASLDFIMFTTDIDASFTFYSGSETQYTDTSRSPYLSYSKFSSSDMFLYTLSDGTKVRAISGGLGRKCYTITPCVPMYNGAPGYESLTSNDLIQAFLEHLLITGDLVPNNGGSIDNPDFQDTTYAFTGFTANNKMTATWTGTTERSYLKDQEVEEYVRVNYYFADKEAQDTIKQADAYPDEFATADKTLTIDVSGLKPDDENWFLRYIRITPCYRQAGLGAWGDFFHGSDVYVYFDVNGKVESIVQNSVPTDGEVIGNNISLIGFRYDTSFHAEFVDVWSNAVNCSAFDLGGSQYLSLGVKALYYNGQSKDIDFVSLDRKNLVWDKTFDSFKTFNGSGIKQLFFTPYIKTGVNNPWNKGNSIVIDFDVNGNATSSFDTGDDGTVHLSDFKLTGVVWNKPMLAYGTITWTGTTANSDMSIVPDSDTLVVCSYPVYDSSLNESYETYDTVTIGKGSIRVYIDSLIDKYSNAGKTWNGEMWLTPCYKKGGVLYMGEPVIVNCIKGTVSDIEVDESTGTANQVDKTDENKSYADAILSSGNNFFSIVKGLIASMQQLPELIATLFSFLPGWVNALIAGSIFVIFVCRILGR